MELWIGAVNLGLLYSFLALGTFITYKIYDFADITVDSSFTLGAAVGAVLVISGVNHFLVIPLVFLAGMGAGFLTGFIHTKFKINGLLAGILVMTGLYSINLRIMDKSNLPLIDVDSFVVFCENLNPGIMSEFWIMCCILVVILFIWVILSVFFKTDIGILMRGTGNNSIMIAANGGNVDLIKIFGIALANGFVALSGNFVAQYQGFADIGMGVGAVVFSLASVIIGEALFKSRSIYVKIVSVIIGSVIFRIMVALALMVGLNPNDLKLITAVFVLFTLVTSSAFDSRKYLTEIKSRVSNLRKNRIANIVLVIVIVLLAAYPISVLYQSIFNNEEISKAKTKIGVLIGNDAQILTITYEGFKDKMEELGYIDGKNCTIIAQNAFGDIPTMNSIIDNFISQDIDIFVMISTPATQAAINKIKDKPIIFATLADPFIIKAGISDNQHLPNVTGIYGTMPIKNFLEEIIKILPNKIKFGVMWNSAFPNSIHNVQVLENVLKEYKGKISLEKTTIVNSNEVMQGAQSLVGKGIDAFFLIPDITVFTAFESIVRASKTKKIPIFTGDVERLSDGALMVYGYDYFTSGNQAAELVNRVIKGEDISKIPFEHYKKVTIGVNKDIASELGLLIPQSIIEKATVIYENRKLTERESSISDRIKKRIGLFQFADNTLLNSTSDGFIKRIEEENKRSRFKFEVEKFNANADYGVGNSIASRLISGNYDYIATVSTLSAQIVSSVNKNIPHIFMAVTDPIKAKVVASFENHPPYLTGLASPQPVDVTIELMRKVFPKAKTIGMIWNNSEVNSEICTQMARQSAVKYNFKLIERTISSSSEIEEAFKSLIAEKIDIFFTSGDVTVTQAVASISAKLEKLKIPYFTNTPEDVNSGALISVGADYFDVGLKGAEILIKISNGQSPKSLPIELYVPKILNINKSVAIRMGLQLPDFLFQQAKLVK